jgi:hypothetical protein
MVLLRLPCPTAPQASVAPQGQGTSVAPGRGHCPSDAVMQQHPAVLAAAASGLSAGLCPAGAQRCGLSDGAAEPEDYVLMVAARAGKTRRSVMASALLF